MNKPNFFIIGAPKCGTTSLGSWLADHPNVYVSPIKEPMWFIDDPRHHNVHSWQAYERLFQGATGSHVAIGEASTSYLFTRGAVRNILNYAADAKFIVMLRNPIEMAPALHEQRVFSGEEHIRNFDKAWAMQGQRKLGHNVSHLCQDSQRLLYGDWCRIGEQLGRTLQQVGPDRTQILFLDDIKTNPRKEYLTVLDFLNVKDDSRENFPVSNQAKERKSNYLNKLVSTAGAAKRKLGVDRGLGLLQAIDRRNRGHRPRVPLTPETLSMLQDYFRDDIRKLENLTGRDLSEWLGDSD